MACDVLSVCTWRRNGAAREMETMENEQQTTAGARKVWGAYNIVERQNGRRFWSRIGSAFKNRDGSYNIFLDSLPLGGKIQIREEDREAQRKEPGALATEAEA
jgi:hypothetical protein